ncbi:hypothetical protein AM500_19040 [Bacillus sp. FJAT-18017]|uniref:fibronectin type III domain-containing protein n=1 Tax=Bacillus sp. FJAT-18017 TaxID=1705566 RepID=UPI0006AECF17|nr:fibronectin type III domain-containing protein [Bacillus sp. FJAT-18017]ALC91646.1 hypothetical protein AM500_19040 [Bacillus sp. FJAT-18017]
MIRKGFLILIAFLLILGGLPANFGPLHQAKAEFIQQTEVPTGYVGIYTAEDLNTKVRSGTSPKYILMNDIDLSEATGENGAFYNNGAGWIPIGTKEHPFRSTFDGNGHKIIGLKQSITSEGIIYAGLFGYVKGSTILNLGMVDSSIAANNNSLDTANAKVYAGGIVGYADGSFGANTISNSYNTGSVSAQSLFDGYAGGIAGYIAGPYSSNSKVSDSFNSGTIQAKTNTGGIVGEAYRTQFSNVYNTADLKGSASRNTGGIVGDIWSNSSIENAYNTGNIEYQTRGGGIAGEASSTTAIKHVYNEGNLSSKASSSDGGGIVGYGTTVTIANSYNKGAINTSGQNGDGGGIAGSLGSSSVSESYNTGDITADSYAGGIAESSNNSVFSKVFNTGTLAARTTGGIVSYGSNITVLNSYNIGTLKAEYTVGGIAAHALSASSIKNTYNAGKLDLLNLTSWKSKGGIVGKNEGTIENSYFIDLVANGIGNETGDGTYKVTLDQLKDPGTFQGFDFTTIWKADNNSTFLFPHLGVVPASGSERNIAMSISSLPAKLKYIEGEQLDVTGGKLIIKTNHGNTKEIEMTTGMVTFFEPTMPGTQYLEVTYDGMTASYSVSVTEKHTVTFADYDGTILKTEEVIHGNPATAPEIPHHEGRTFTGWNQSFSNVRDDLYIEALYSLNQYTMTYRDGDSILHSQTYKYGDTPKAPDQPNKEGFAFLDWYREPDFRNLFSFTEPIKSDLALYAKFVKIPNQPKNLAVKPGLGYAKVTWAPVEGADGYSVWWLTSPYANSYNGSRVEGNTTEHETWGLDPDQTYYFKVVAHKYVDGRQIDSPDSQLVSARTALTTPTAPKATPVGADKVKLNWTKSPDATGYQIFRAESSGGPYKMINVVTETYKEEFLNTGLIPGKTYHYKIRAYSEMNGRTYYSSYTNVLSAKPVLASSRLSAASAGYDRVKLTWTKSADATGYEIYRATSSTGSYSKIATITPNSTLSYINTGLPTGKRYYYKIRVYKTVAGVKYYTAYSNVVYATPVLSAITAKAASAGYNKLKVSWNVIPGANGYEVYRATSLYGTYSNIKTITSGSTSSYINTSLSTGRTYYYKVRAYRVVGGKKVYNSFSKVASAKPVLAAPARISLAKASSTSIRVSWYKVAEASGYEVFRSTSKTGTYSKVKTITSGSTISFTNTSLTRGKTYYYKVRAYKVVSGKKIYSSYTTILSYKL